MDKLKELSFSDLVTLKSLIEHDIRISSSPNNKMPMNKYVLNEAQKRLIYVSMAIQEKKEEIFK